MADEPREHPDAPSESPDAPPEGHPPLGQRLFDSPFLLLGAGLFVMIVFFTLWGLWEVLSLTPAPLP